MTRNRPAGSDGPWKPVDSTAFKVPLPGHKFWESPRRVALTQRRKRLTQSKFASLDIYFFFYLNWITGLRMHDSRAVYDQKSCQSSKQNYCGTFHEGFLSLFCSARASKVFALTDAAGLESFLLVAFFSGNLNRFSPSLIYARTHDETPHHSLKIYWYKKACESPEER
jgi:hypothetical protein